MPFSSLKTPRLPLLLKEKDCRPRKEKNSGRAWFESELGPVGAERMLDSAGSREVEGTAGRQSWQTLPSLVSVAVSLAARVALVSS